jgi:hypothetical protein
MIGIIALALAVASPPDPAWLSGSWLLIKEESDRDLAACASGLPIAYNADGTYTLFEESGTWRLTGDKLVEVATEVHEDVASAEEVALGKEYVSRIERLGPDEMRKLFADGVTMTLLRCPEAQ